jgi:dihydropteroate synthase
MLITNLILNNPKDIKYEMQKIGVDSCGIDIMLSKAQSSLLKIDKITNPCANILKQQMLSLGGDAAVSKQTIVLKDGETSVILIGTKNIFNKLKHKLKGQPFGLADIGLEIENTINNAEKQNVLSINGKKLKNKTSVMGILNVNYDSFYDGGKYKSIKDAIDYAKIMIEQGAEIIDIGGESTRPGSEYISLEEEKKRVLPVVEALRKESDILISIDTNKSEIAKACIDIGVDIINDISGLKKDSEMVNVVSKNGIALILMHSKNDPSCMQDNPCYDDVMQEILLFFKQQTDFVIKNGIKKENIFIDPGIGFGKTLDNNLVILKRLKEFKSLGFPIVIGASRKSFIGKILDNKVEERLIGSVSSSLISAVNGASIIRAHDVKETVEALKILEAVHKSI